MNFALQPVQRRRLYQDIVDRLEKMMLSGNLPAGAQLPSERELMATFQVGRTSVREALFALQRMGLVSLNSGERACVTTPTPKALLSELSGSARHLLASEEGTRSFQQARIFFEVGLCREAARHASAEDIAGLERALHANKAALGNTEKFVDSDVAFHFVLAEITRNPIFTALHHALAAWLREERSTSVRMRGSDKAAYRAHERILKAIAERDPDAAEAAMRGHLEQVNRYYWKAQERT
jgi:GntR family transcriptional regulator, sialic acid-inducible nan operon repressor